MNLRGLLDGRAIAIFIVAAVAGSSFVLGFFVGKAVEVKSSARQGAPAGIIKKAPRLKRPQKTKARPQKPKTQSSKTTAPKAQSPKTTAPKAALAPETAAKPKAAQKPVAQMAASRSKKTPKKESRPPKTAAKAKTYTVQIGAFQDREDAESLRRKFAKKGYTAYITLSGTGSVYKVRLGKFSDRQEAASLAARLMKTERVKSFVTAI